MRTAGATATFDGPLALKYESEFDEELSRGCEVVNHDAACSIRWIVMCGAYVERRPFRPNE
jgi:hypothetical protein